MLENITLTWNRVCDNAISSGFDSTKQRRNNEDLFLKINGNPILTHFALMDDNIRFTSRALCRSKVSALEPLEKVIPLDLSR